MIIVRLIGGLANQMFPYAAARRLAHVLDTELKLDISGFSVYEGMEGVEYRHYALSHFNIIESLATPAEIEHLSLRAPGFIDRLFRKRPRRPSTYIKEKQYHFDPRILDLKGDIYLAGNWVSPKYFDDIAEIIRHDFSFKKEAEGKNAELLEMIKQVESVSIHVRRGDYASNQRVNELHGTCELDYYQRSMEIIQSKVKNPVFFVFSDDIEWARNNLMIKKPVQFIDHNGPLNGHEDIRLMSHCKHNIIANSGFSWWSAWLNANPGKIVLAPDKWFNNPKINTSTLVPTTWQRI